MNLYSESIYFALTFHAILDDVQNCLIYKYLNCLYKQGCVWLIYS